MPCCPVQKLWLCVIKCQVGVIDLFTFQGNWRPHVQMEAGLPPSAAPAQCLSAAKEAGVYQCYTQLCCPSVSTAQGSWYQRSQGPAIGSSCLPACLLLKACAPRLRQGGGKEAQNSVKAAGVCINKYTPPLHCRRQGQGRMDGKTVSPPKLFLSSFAQGLPS